jgi:hypothetical protein
MTKITIEFDSIEEAQTALDGYKWKLAMWDLDQELRNTTKYGKSVVALGDTKASGVEQNVAERYREIIREILTNHELVI